MGIDIGRLAHVMAAMGEPGPLDAKLGGHLNRLFEADVGVVGNVTQGLDNQVFNPLQFGQQVFADFAQVGNVGKIADTESITG